MTFFLPIRIRGLSFGASIVFFLLLTNGSAAGTQGCFSRLHTKNHPKDKKYFFDLQFDKTKTGESFSCDLEVRPSEARSALEAFRQGVLYDSETHINDSMAFPVTARVFQTREATERPALVEIRNFSEWLDFKKEHLTKFHVAQIACASLHSVTIVKSRSHGFTIGDGLVWFQRSMTSSKVKVTAINLTPADQGTVVESCAK